MDITPIWLLAIFVVLVLFGGLGLEILKQHKDPENTHYDFAVLFGRKEQK